MSIPHLAVTRTSARSQSVSVTDCVLSIKADRTKRRPPAQKRFCLRLGAPLHIRRHDRQIPVDHGRRSSMCSRRWAIESTTLQLAQRCGRQAHEQYDIRARSRLVGRSSNLQPQMGQKPINVVVRPLSLVRHDHKLCFGRLISHIHPIPDPRARVGLINDSEGT
jgi:hypothetical protein